MENALRKAVHDIAFSSTGKSGTIPGLSGEQCLESLGWLSTLSWLCFALPTTGACIYPAGSWVLRKTRARHFIGAV